MQAIYKNFIFCVLKSKQDLSQIPRWPARGPFFSRIVFLCVFWLPQTRGILLWRQVREESTLQNLWPLAAQPRSSSVGAKVRGYG